MISALLALALASGPSLVLGAAHDGVLAPERVVSVVAGEPATLSVAVVLPDGGCVAAREGITAEGRRCAAAPGEVATTARWFLAVPIAADYDNTAACTARELARGCHAPIRYREVELVALRGTFEVDASRVPALAAPGTHRVAVRVAWDGATLSAPDAAAGPPMDETAPSWLALVVRRDDGYVGRLTELLGLPFALVPVSIPGVGHQTDARLAADCVALVVYGQRRLGRQAPYLSPRALRERLAPIGRADTLEDLARGIAELGPIREGDVLHFGFQTAVLARDLPPVGRLDPDDVVLHAYHGVVEELPVRLLPYRRHPVEVLRWPAGGEPAR